MLIPGPPGRLSQPAGNLQNGGGISGAYLAFMVELIRHIQDCKDVTGWLIEQAMPLIGAVSFNEPLDPDTGVNNDPQGCNCQRLGGLCKRSGLDPGCLGSANRRRRMEAGAGRFFCVVLLHRALHKSFGTICAPRERLRKCASCRTRSYSSSAR